MLRPQLKAHSPAVPQVSTLGVVLCTSRLPAGSRTQSSRLPV